MDYDLIIAGAGMAGLTAGAAGVRAGMRVALVEKSSRLGGSAALSSGVLWCPRSSELLATVDPGGPPLGEEVIVHYPRSLDFVRSMGVSIGPRLDEVLGYGTGHVIDILAYLRECAREVEASGGSIVTNAEIVEIKTAAGKVTGCVVNDRDGETSLATRNIMLATGGFQASQELRTKYVGSGAQSILLRGNPDSNGGGLKLGLAVGAALTKQMDGFYGHLIASPLKSFAPADYTRLTQSYCAEAIVISKQGKRIADESIGYASCAQAATALPNSSVAVIFDETVHTAIRTHAPVGVTDFEIVDRFQEATAAGARTAVAGSLGELATSLGQWGFDEAETLNTIANFNVSVGATTDQLVPPRTWNRRPIADPPFYAVVAEPAITCTYGGLKIDRCGRVLDSSDQPIGGLFAAGADGAGVWLKGYGGGLVLGTTFGISAVEAMTSHATGT